MIAVVLGTGQDVGGFALAGVEGHVCGTAAELAQEVSVLRGRPEVALVLVSREVGRLAPAEIVRLEGVDGPPAVIVLAGGGA